VVKRDIHCLSHIVLMCPAQVHFCLLTRSIMSVRTVTFGFSLSISKGYQVETHSWTP